MNNFEDLQKVEEMQKGSEAAFTFLYKKYAGNVKRFVGGMGLTCHEVEDICQEVWITVWKKSLTISLFEHTCFVAWLMMVARNKTNDYFRRRNKAENRKKRFALERAGEDIMLPKQPNFALVEAFLLLNKRQAAVLAYNLLGYRHREIAQKMHTSSESAAYLLWYTIQKLKKLLNGTLPKAA